MRHRMRQDVIFDGTMMWAPFVEQTIAMVRDHRHKYRRGPGYHKSDGCNVERHAAPGLRPSAAHSVDQTLGWLECVIDGLMWQPGLPDLPVSMPVNVDTEL